ncbi:MAG: SRPBCC family protein [Pseudonocardiaceae bacterium]
MTTTAPIPPITGTVTLGVSAEQAFQVFTGSFDIWWPHEYHIGNADVAEVILESHEGGRWYERGVDGTECDWGRVLVWEPPHRLVFTWQISGAWEFDPDPEHASEIEVRFTATAPGLTIVEVDHRHFDRLEGGRAVHDAIRGGGGWALLLQSFAKAVANQQ